MNADYPELRFYGRRKGKKLHAARQDAYDTFLPEVRIALPEGTEPVDPQVFFPEKMKDIHLEIGFGTGENLLHFARNNPDTGFIGCEPFINGVASLCKDIREHNIKNIRIWPDDARLLTARLKPQSLGCCFILNSDPWPKKRHHKRRFVQKETLDELHGLLKPGAALRMSSDHPGLAQWQFEKAYFHGGYSWTAENAAGWRKRPADMEETRYQQKLMAGHPVVFLNFVRD